ncbi:uncharacterized protein LOC127242180 [Andrographis paniculata]|uniref:uncharacterized protein LOC127242180 n=1 Tax=Andrographis paniculata TaxID=175694 RepID=UPI0021E75923|nr:uncharacterized protein LOC127242180 [Andrographis paniculata]
MAGRVELGLTLPSRLHFSNSSPTLPKLFNSSASAFVFPRRSLSLSVGGLWVLLSSLSMSSSSSLPTMKPPVAKKVRHEMENFGDVRVDNYYWLRDDSRSDPQVLAYLREENAYTDHAMSGTKQLEAQINSEIRGRLQEDDISAPLRDGPYYYYERTLKGKEYVQHCRRAVVNVTQEPSVNDTMPRGPDAPAEHIILDENVKAQDHEFYSVDAFEVSPNHKLVAYAEDTKGDETYTGYIIDAESGELVEKPLVRITPGIEWVGDDALAYITRDEILRPDKVWLHKLGTDQSSDRCLYHEKDDMFSIDIDLSESEKFLFVESSSKTTRFVFYLDISKPENGLVPLTQRVDGIETSASHRGNHFFIKRRSNESFNSELIACPVDNTSAITIVLPHRPSINIQEMQLYRDHIVVLERENGLPKITTYHLPGIGEPLRPLEGGRAVDFIDSVYDVDSMDSQFSSTILRFKYSSLRTPPSYYDYDMNSGISVLKKIDPVLGGFDSANYITERQWATAADGTQIPISIVYRKDLVKLDGSDPLLLSGYGSYGLPNDASFKASRLSLLDRGFVFALAHIRGGGEMGRLWYENGKLLKKRNTFTDFIACAEYLLEKKYCSKEKLCIEGRSAGGLLIGAVLNMRPDLFKAAVAGVPFVDVVTTMLDASIPLTTAEYEEWGDPRKENFYFYMKSYSPVDNIIPQSYPAILVTAGLYDTRVLYSEPAKFVAKLRDTKTDDNILLFKCELGAGHFSKSGRFEKLQEDAFTYTYILKTLKMDTAAA